MRRGTWLLLAEVLLRHTVVLIMFFRMSTMSSQIIGDPYTTHVMDTESYICL